MVNVTDEDGNLIDYEVTYRVEPNGSTCVVTRSERRVFCVGLIHYSKETGKWRTRFRDDEEWQEGFDSIEEARIILVRRYEDEIS